MRHWLWRLMGVLSLGGGFNGLVYGFSALSEGSLGIWLTVALGSLIYAYGLWSGLRLLEGRPGAERMNLLYWWIQVPFIDTPLVSFTIYGGVSAILTGSLGWTPTGADNWNFAAKASFGSSFTWSYLQGDVPWKFGVNVVACLFSWWGELLLRRQKTPSELDIW